MRTIDPRNQRASDPGNRVGCFFRSVSPLCPTLARFIRKELLMLNAREIVPGLVSYLDYRKLTRDDRIICSQPIARAISKKLDPRPMVCVQVIESVAVFAPLTSEPFSNMYPRIEIPYEWKQGGTFSWLATATYLNDGATFFWGPLEVFVDASYTDQTVASGRARVVPRALNAILDEMRLQITNGRVNMTPIRPFINYPIAA